MKEKLIKAFNDLGIADMEKVMRLYKLKGDFINLECTLPNGQTAKLLEDDKFYYGAELCKKNSSRCYGLAADDHQLVVYEYGEGGTQAELVVWKRL